MCPSRNKAFVALFFFFFSRLFEPNLMSFDKFFLSTDISAQFNGKTQASFSNRPKLLQRSFVVSMAYCSFVFFEKRHFAVLNGFHLRVFVNSPAIFVFGRMGGSLTLFFDKIFECRKYRYGRKFKQIFVK